MCNFLHKDSTPIAREGYGWKLFEKDDSTLISLNKYTPNSENDMIHYNGVYYAGEGFCFFLLRREAIVALKLWKQRILRISNPHMHKIVYSNGLGSHIERGFIADMELRIALCGDFKIIK
jgi:hypothetical protein